MKVVEFLRVSTEDQGSENRAGLPRQREANALTIAKHNLTVVKTISIIDVSGTSVMQAPEVQELLSFIGRREADGVVVADWDRLIRLDNYKDFALLQHFKEAHTLIFLPDQIIDLNTQSGFLVGGFQSIISGNELTQIKKRMLTAKEIKRRKGEHPNNLMSLPIGVSYNYLERRYFYTEEVQKVQQLFNYFFQLGILNYRELERRTGIHHRTIFNVLRNELYIGYRSYTEKRASEKTVKPNGRQGDRKKVKRSPDEIIRVKVIDNPAVDEKTFWKAQEIIKTKNRDYHATRSRPGKRFLYTGFLICGACGEKIYSTSGGRNHQKDYYYCRSKNYQWAKVRPGSPCQSHYLPKQAVETIVTSFVSERLTDKCYLKEMVCLALSHDGFADIRVEMDRLPKLIRQTEIKRSKVLDLYVDGILSKDELDKKAQDLAREIKMLQMRLKSAEDDMLLKERLSTDDNIHLLVTTLTEFPFWSSSQKRSFLQSQIPEISITREGITGFTLNFCEERNRTGTGSWPPPA